MSGSRCRHEGLYGNDGSCALCARGWVSEPERARDRTANARIVERRRNAAPLGLPACPRGLSPKQSR